jgi:hypothetical protein
MEGIVYHLQLALGKLQSPSANGNGEVGQLSVWSANESDVRLPA